MNFPVLTTLNTILMNMLTTKMTKKGESKVDLQSYQSKSGCAFKKHFKGQRGN